MAETVPRYHAGPERHLQYPLADSFGASTSSVSVSGSMGTVRSGDMLLLTQHQNAMPSGISGQPQSNESLRPGLPFLQLQQQQLMQQLQLRKQHEMEMGMMMSQHGAMAPPGSEATAPPVPEVKQISQEFHHQQQQSAHQDESTAIPDNSLYHDANASTPSRKVSKNDEYYRWL